MHRTLTVMGTPPKPVSDLSTPELGDYVDMLVNGDGARLWGHVVLAEVEQRLAVTHEGGEVEELERMRGELDLFLTRENSSWPIYLRDTDARSMRDCGQCMCSIASLEDRTPEG
jgi:hypothetical protein